MELEELLNSSNLIIMGSHEYPGLENIQFWGGVGEVVRNISERLVQRGFDVLVLPRLATEYAPHKTLFIEHKGVHFLTTQIKRFRAGKENADLYMINPSYETITCLDHSYSTWEILKRYKMNNPVIHAHDWLGVAWAREGKRRGYRTVLTVHMSVDRTLENLASDKRLELERLAGSYSQVIHYVSFSTYKSCRIHSWNGNKRHCVIPNGVDINKFSPLEHKVPEEYVLFIGRLVPVKNVPPLIQGWSIFNEKYPDVKLKILGAPGSSYVDVLETYNSLKEEKRKRVELRLEMVSFEERLNYLRNATVFCAPSSKEAFGIVAIEAESCGIPVVVGDVGGFKENVLEGVTGVHVDGTDPSSIAEGLELAYLNRKYFGQNGRRLVEEYFNWDKIVERYIDELYRT